MPQRKLPRTEVFLGFLYRGQRLYVHDRSNDCDTSVVSEFKNKKIGSHYYSLGAMRSETQQGCIDIICLRGRGM